MKSVDSGDRQEEALMIDTKHDNKNNEFNSRDVELGMEPNGSKMEVMSSYDYWEVAGLMAVDGGNIGQRGSGSGDGGVFTFQKRQKEEMGNPPSKLMGQFLQNQKASGELSSQNLHKEGSVPPLVTESPTNQQVSSRGLEGSIREPVQNSDTISPDSNRRSCDEEFYHHHHQNHSRKFSKSGVVKGGEKGEVLRCTSNSTFRQNSSYFLKTKTIKSRLMEPPQLLVRPNDKDEGESFIEEGDYPGKFEANFSAITIFQWVSLILILAAFVCTHSIPIFTKRILWDFPLWKWELLVLVLICGRLVSGWGIRVVVFFIERNCILRKRVLYFVYGVRKAVQNCFWLGLVLIAWHLIFDEKVVREVKSKTVTYISKILTCLLVAAFLWLMKVVLVKALASSFHVKAYFERIQIALFYQYVIETLSNNNTQEEEGMAEVQELQNAGANIPTTMKNGKIIGNGKPQWIPQVGRSFRFSEANCKQQDEGLMIDQLHKLNKKNISAWNMKRMMKKIQGNIMVTLDERMQDSSSEDESTAESRRKCEVEYVAKKIFNNVAKQGSDRIFGEDLMDFMSRDKALKTMSLFEEVTESKKVDKSAIKNWVNKAFQERKELRYTLNDNKTAVKQLHYIASVFVSLVIVVLWLIVLGIATTQLLVFISSQLLVAVFIFGNTCKMVFEAIIFLFVMHPFDVGDYCEVDGVQMTVEETNILTTVFLRFDSQKIIYPNSVLTTKPISNYNRSPDMGDAIDFCVHISTSLKKIAQMKQRITRCIEENMDHWYPDPTIVLRDVEDMNRLKFSVWPRHRMNHQNMRERWRRRALLIEEMIKIFRELEIEFRLLPRDVNVRNMPDLTSRLPSNWNACST